MFRLVFVTLCLTLLGSATALAQQPGEVGYEDTPELPAGVAGERIKELIDVFNSNDPQGVQAFIETHFTEEFRGLVPMEEHLDVVLGIFRDTGGLDFHSIRTYVPPREGEMVVILRDRNFGAWRAFVVSFDGSPDYRIAGLQFSDARTPRDVAAPGALSEPAAIELAAAMVQRVCERDAFSGTVLIARDEAILYTHACGEASKSFHVANDIDTKFNLGSMNKMFTATAIAQLVERGVVSYDDPISEYVDETWLPREMTDKIKVRHLLSHTSGLGSYFNDTYWNSSRELYRTVDDFKPLVQGETLAFEPGERFRYSNTGMLLAGVVIESASGQSYFDYVRQNIFAPADMNSTDSFEMDLPVDNLAIGYLPDRQAGWRNNLYKHVIKGGPAGGGFSTVADLHRFALALRNGELVSEESLAEMWRPQSDEAYGFGFGIGEGPLGKDVGHSGGFPGISADLTIFADAGYVVAVLSNYSRAASAVSDEIRKLLERTAEP